MTGKKEKCHDRADIYRKNRRNEGEGQLQDQPGFGRVYTARLRAGSPLCLAAAADQIYENGESLLELDGKEALDRLNRWQAEKLLSDKERAALNLLLKIHNIEPFSRGTAERIARGNSQEVEKKENGVTTLKPFLLRQMREEQDRDRELPVSLYNILSALRQVTKNRREVAEVPAYTLLMRALLLNDGFLWNSDVTEQELRPGGSHYEDKKQRVSPEAVLFLTATGCGVPIEPGFWRKKEWRDAILSLLEAGLLLPDGKNLRTDEGAEQEGFLELWKAAGICTMKRWGTSLHQKKPLHQNNKEGQV